MNLFRRLYWFNRCIESRGSYRLENADLPKCEPKEFKEYIEKLDELRKFQRDSSGGGLVVATFEGKSTCIDLNEYRKHILRPQLRNDSAPPSASPAPRLGARLGL